VIHFQDRERLREQEAEVARLRAELDAEHAALLASREAIQHYCDDDARLRARLAEVEGAAQKVADALERPGLDTTLRWDLDALRAVLSRSEGRAPASPSETREPPPPGASPRPDDKE